MTDNQQQGKEFAQTQAGYAAELRGEWGFDLPEAVPHRLIVGPAAQGKTIIRDPH